MRYGTNDTDKMVEMVFGSNKNFCYSDKVTGLAVHSQMACVKCYVLVSKVWFFALKPFDFGRKFPDDLSFTSTSTHAFLSLGRQDDG